MTDDPELSAAAEIFNSGQPEWQKKKELIALLPDLEASTYLSDIAKGELFTTGKITPTVIERSRFQNCFYYFRGPTKKSETVATINRQLEDNATKALINVLEHSDRSVLDGFLSSVVGETEESASPRLNLKDASGKTPQWPDPAHFFLQGGPQQAAHHCLLVGISTEGEIDPGSWGQKSQGSRVDGSIDLPGRLTLLIESKVVSELDGSQLNRHAEHWGLPQGAAERLPSEWLLKTWADIHQWAREALGKTEAEPSRFLLGQFQEFLELAGLAPTWILRSEHFAYLEAPPEGRDPMIQQEIKRRLESLWKRIEADLGAEEFQREFGEVTVGNLGVHDNHAWAQTNSDVGPTAVNLTIELVPDYLTVNMVGWFKQQGEQLERWLLSDAGQSFARAHPEYSLVPFVIRGNPGRNNKVMWKGAKGTQLPPLSGEMLESEDLRLFLAAHRQEHSSPHERLGFHFRRSWPRPAAIAHDDIAGELAHEVELLRGPLKEARSGSGQ